MIPGPTEGFRPESGGVKARSLLVCGLALMVTLAIAAVVAPGVRAGGSTASSQIALSCQGAPTPPSNANECVGTPTSCPRGDVCSSNIGGFWVWCETPTASNGYKGECNGAIYQEEATAGVFAYQVSSMTGEATGSSPPFTVTVGPSSSVGECAFTVSAALLRGQSNTIPASCGGTISISSSGIPTTTGAFTAVFSGGTLVAAFPVFSGTFAPGVAILT